VALRSINRGRTPRLRKKGVRPFSCVRKKGVRPFSCDELVAAWVERNGWDD